MFKIGVGRRREKKQQHLRTVGSLKITITTTTKMTLPLSLSLFIYLFSPPFPLAYRTPSPHYAEVITVIPPYKFNRIIDTHSNHVHSTHLRYNNSFHQIDPATFSHPSILSLPLSLILLLASAHNIRTRAALLD